MRPPQEPQITGRGNTSWSPFPPATRRNFNEARQIAGGIENLGDQIQHSSIRLQNPAASNSERRVAGAAESYHRRTVQNAVKSMR